VLYIESTRYSGKGQITPPCRCAPTQLLPAGTALADRRTRVIVRRWIGPGVRSDFRQITDLATACSSIPEASGALRVSLGN